MRQLHDLELWSKEDLVSVLPRQQALQMHRCPAFIFADSTATPPRVKGKKVNAKDQARISDRIHTQPPYTPGFGLLVPNWP